jgi:hypothetical protein
VEAHGVLYFFFVFQLSWVCAVPLLVVAQVLPPGPPRRSSFESAKQTILELASVLPAAVTHCPLLPRHHSIIELKNPAAG